MPRDAQIGPLGRELRFLEQGNDPCYISVANQTHALRQARSQYTPRRHRLTVKPSAEAQSGLDGVAKRVTQIEQGPHTGLPLVCADDLGLQLAGAANGVRQRPGFARHKAPYVGFQPSKEGGVADQPVLDDFGQPADNSRSDSVSSVLVSASTSRGW